MITNSDVQLVASPSATDTDEEAVADKSSEAAASTPPTDEQLDASAKASLDLFNERVVLMLNEFEAYRAKAQAGSLEANDEKRAEIAIAHLRAIVETHKPLPPLPHALAQ